MLLQNWPISSRLDWGKMQITLALCWVLEKIGLLLNIGMPVAN